MTMYRQGDVLIFTTNQTKQEYTELEKKDAGRIILQYGEVTGHAHAIIDDNVEVWRKPDQSIEQDRFMRVLVDGGVDLVHEEHDTIRLPKGDYIVRRQREYQPDGWSYVAD